MATDFRKGRTAMKYGVWLAVAAVAALSGCATITRGTTQAWTVETDPVGANVELSSGEKCVTPCTLKKKRKDGFTVSIVKDGYRAVRTEVLSSVSGAGAAGMAGNVIVGGLIGIGVDAASGATRDLTPNPLVVKMEHEEVSSSRADGAFDAGETIMADGSE
ncbi:MAG TPA: PEGA domain-containing protein [Xanthomonadaceae bacterium]|nr:PEGA domain-containing protein [Xanthomonadaceae bacterium]